MMKQYYIYILTNSSKTLYVSVTSNLIRRVWEHKKSFIDGFTKKYKLKKLVYYEQSDNINSAISREKQIKGYRRNKKLALIERINPEWKDLFFDLR